MPTRRRKLSVDTAQKGGKSQAPAGQKQRASNGQFGPGNPYRWQPGQSGNPGGAPKGPRLSAILQEVIGQTMPADGQRALKDLIDAGATIGQIIAMALALKAAEGNLDAVNVLADRTEGAPEQSLNVFDAEAVRQKRWAQAAEALQKADQAVGKLAFRPKK